MIKVETIESPDKSNLSCKMELHGAPNELGAEMHAIIKVFVRNLLEPCIPGRELKLSMFLAKRFAQAVHEAYQEHMQGVQHEHTD